MKAADERARQLHRRVAEATSSRAPQASAALAHKLRALSDYKFVPTPRGGSARGAVSSSGHQYARLAKMIGIGLANSAEGILADTSDQVTARMPDRVGAPVSGAIGVAHEIRSNWDSVYRLTPEYVSMHLRNIRGGK